MELSERPRHCLCVKEGWEMEKRGLITPVCQSSPSHAGQHAVAPSQQMHPLVCPTSRQAAKHSRLEMQSAV